MEIKKIYHKEKKISVNIIKPLKKPLLLKTEKKENQQEVKKNIDIDNIGIILPKVT